MRKTRVQMMAAAAAAAMLLGGCGEAPYELTKEEENIVVNYAAHVLAKYNKYQKDGLTYVLEEEPAGEPVIEEAAEEPAEISDTAPESTEAGYTAGETENTDLAETAALQDIFGMDGLNIAYVGARIADSYTESDYYALNPDPGKFFLIVGIDVSNTSDAAVNLNILGSMPQFTATVNQNITSASEVTILTEDFSTYEGTIEAGETVETVLLFQIPDTVSTIDSLDVNAVLNGNNYRIILESLEN